MRRIFVAAVATALSITGLFASPALADGEDGHHETGHNWKVQAGYLSFAGPVPSGGGNRFYPEAVTIHQGDSITFSPMGAHTITFNRPPVPVFLLIDPRSGFITTFPAKITSPTQLVNSGLVGDVPGTKYKITFGSRLPAGRYTVICGLHVGMSETVDLLPKGAGLPKDDDDYAAIAQQEITRDMAAQADIAATANRNNGDKEDENGKTVWVGAGNDRVSTLRFFPSTITVHVGDTVTFIKTHDPTEPHTVTFGTENPDPIAQLIPSGGNTYDGTGTVNSGFLSTKQQFAYYHLAGAIPGLGQVTKFKVKFTVANTSGYTYICELHDFVGMTGRVIVKN